MCVSLGGGGGGGGGVGGVGLRATIKHLQEDLHKVTRSEESVIRLVKKVFSRLTNGEELWSSLLFLVEMNGTRAT